MKTTLIILLCFLASSAEAGPKKVVKSFGSQVKRTFYTDVKAHPIAWGLTMGINFAILFSDTGSSCAAYARGFIEDGLSKHFIGIHPNCRKDVLFTGTLFTINAMSVNWLTNSFKDSCDHDAGNPGSKWWSTPSHTKSTNACYWGPAWANTGALAIWEIPTVVDNVRLLEKK